MKKLSLFFSSLFALILLSFSTVSAQEFDVQLTPSLYAGGYNISCYGANTGSINLFITGGVAPYTYVWADGPIIRNRTNLVAGNYQVTVTTSNGQSVIREINLTQPDLFQVTLSPLEYEGGYNVNENGGSNGEIGTEIRGGVPPYNYLWSNGGIESRIDHLTAGNYSISVHDATNCVANASTILIEPTVLHVVSITGSVHSSGYNIVCNKNCKLSLTVAGGTPFSENGGSDYRYEWSNGTAGADTKVNEAGTYTVTATDDNGASVTASIMVTQAPNFSAEITPFVYSNSKNTSCYNCNNGSISTIIHSGTAPYTYTWNNGSHVQNPNGLGAGSYTVVMKDAAGCQIEKTTMITAPEREDWTMGGNLGTNPANQFMGTKDSVDLVFRTSDTEILRLDKRGKASFKGLLTAEQGIALNPSQTMKIAYKSELNKEIVVFGDEGDVNTPDVLQNCPNTNYNGILRENRFFGIFSLRPHDPEPNVKSALKIGSAPWDGSGIIEVEGTADDGSTKNGLLINYFCGRDVNICTNVGEDKDRGFVRVGKHFEVGGPYVTPTTPEVTANIQSSANTGLKVLTVKPVDGITPLINTQLSVNEIQTKIISGTSKNGSWFQEIFSIKGDGETRIGSDVSITEPSFFIKPFFNGSALTTSYVGIGTDELQARLDVNGDVRISDLKNSTSTFNLIQADGDGKLSKVSPLTQTGLGLWETNSTDVFRQIGNVGIGTNNATKKLTVNGDVQFLSSVNPNESFEILLSENNNIPTRRGIAVDQDNSGKFNLYIHSWQPSASFNFIDGNNDNLHPNLMSIYPNGKVGIGDPANYPGDYKLYVTGGILTEKLKIALGTSTDWMDKVFDKEYKLTSLKELEKYIDKNKHLPEIPTTAQVQKDGIDIGTMVAKLLQKNEELTLYVIQINKENNALKERVQLLEKAK